MEHLVGITLIVLAFYVFYAVVRHGRAFRMRSRWMLLFGAVQRGARRLQARTRNVLVVEHEHEHSLEEAHADAHPATVGGGVAGTRTGATHSHRHQHVGTMPDDPFGQYGRRSSFLVGMLHGFGAETPTQVLIFVAAAGAGGSAVGVLLLCCFLVGLVTSNTLVAAAGTFGFLSASHNFPLYVVVSLLTASFSLVIGVVFLLGRATVLPAFFGG
jgi:high-affinity nickel-transport protein